MRIMKRIGAFTSALILSIASLSVLTASIVHAAGPFTCTWTGSSGSNFSTAANWTGCNSSSPQPGDHDNLVFNDTSLSGAESTPNNDVTGLTVGSVTFTGSNATYSFQIVGNSMTITGGVTDSTSSIFPTGFTNTVIVSGNQALSTSHTYGTYFATLQGSGNLAVSGGGKPQFADLSGYTGTISSSDSNIELMTYTTFTSSGGVAVSGNSALTLNDESARSANAVFTLPISLGGNGISKIGALNLVGQGNGDSITLAGKTTLTSDVQVTADGNTTLNVTGPIVYNGHSISSAGQNVTTITVAQGSDHSSDNPFVGNNVTYFDDGTVGNTTVNNGGLLKGNGTLASANIQSGGSIAPGHSPGCMTVSGNFTLSGTYTEQIQSPGNTACTDYDQMKVGGTVTLTGGTLSVNFLSGFSPSVGQTYEIIANQGGSSVVGTFSGMPEGDVFAVGSLKLQITYKGAGGNNVVLTVVSPNTPLGAPNTGFGIGKRLLNPLGVFAGFAIVSGAVYLLGRRFKTTS